LVLSIEKSDFIIILSQSIGNQIIADSKYILKQIVKHEITRAYGIEHPDGVALRASFLIDKEGIVQHQIVNNLPLGRNVEEMIRLVDALQFTEQYGEVCPAGWNKGETGMKPTAEGVAAFLSKHAEDL